MTTTSHHITTMYAVDVMRGASGLARSSKRDWLGDVPSGDLPSDPAAASLPDSHRNHP